MSMDSGLDKGESESHSVMSNSAILNSPGQNTWVDSLSLLQENLPNPMIEPRSPTLRADSLPAKPQGKPKNTGVSSLFLLQQIFPTQELNLGLLHCTWILYQLSYQRSPDNIGEVVCVYSGIWLSHWKEWDNTICSNMIGPRDSHTKWSKSEKDKYHMISVTCGI